MKKNGFTLIEVLMIIALLAILALIVTPIISGVIEKTKISSYLRSAEGYYASINNTTLNEELEPSATLEDGIYSTLDLDGKGIQYGGMKPDDGTISILNNEVKTAEFIYKGYKIYIKKDGSAELLSNAKEYGLRWDGNNTYTRLNDAKDMISCVGTDIEECSSDFDEAEIFGEMQDITIDGNAFVFIPKFYIKKVVNGSVVEWYVSKNKKDSTYYLPESFHSIESHQELPYTLIGKYNASIDASKTKLESKTEMTPLVDTNMTKFRTYALANNTSTQTGYHLFDIHDVDLIKTLFYIEYSTVNVQSIMRGYADGLDPWVNTRKIVDINGKNLTLASGEASGFFKGQLIDVGTYGGARDVVTNLLVTDIQGDTLTVKDVYETNYLQEIALNNVVYNVANINGQTDKVLAQSGSSIDNTSGKYSMKYRGIENLYGNILQIIDGVSVNKDTSTIYVNRNSKTYVSDGVGGDYIGVAINGLNAIGTKGWITKMGYNSNYPFIEFPIETGTFSASKYKDYYSTRDGGTIKMITFGGSWTCGDDVGLTSTNIAYGSDDDGLYTGSRLSKKAY